LFTEQEIQVMTETLDKAKGLRKNNFTFLTEPTCSSNQARSCGE